MNREPPAAPAAALPADFPRSIAREALNVLPLCRWDGAVHVIATPDRLDRAIDDIGGERVLGFDTETRPAFRVGESYLPSLVQLATSTAVYLFQVQQVDCAAALRGVFADARIVKAGVSVADDLRKLKQVFAFEDQSVLDLGRIAKRHGLAQTGVRNLVGIFLGTRVPKGAQTTNWAAPQLTPQQIAYAATDAWACRELYLRFESLGLV
jgi:ribonuclease D